MLNFKGGIKPDAHKYTKNIPLAEALSPEYVKIYTYGDIPCVMTGDIVSIGQQLTRCNKAHASVCGMVIEIANSYITIRNDRRTDICSSCVPFNKKLSRATYDDIISFAETKGIRYGSEFLTDKLEKNSETAKILIVSCGETEPFSCSRYKTLAKYKKEIFYGTKIIMKALGLTKAAVTLEATYLKEYYNLKKLVGKTGNIEIITHTSKYPAEHPVVLKKEFCKKYVSKSSDITEDNILVISCEEAAALFTSFRNGLPMVGRLVTVDGDSVYTPRTVYVPIGTPVEYLLSLCEAENHEIKALVCGNPICGSQISPEDAVLKETSTVLALGEKFCSGESRECISCGRCHKACPVGLYPDRFLEFNSISRNCIRCGACTYICPSKIDFSFLYNETEVKNDG